MYRFKLIVIAILAFLVLIVITQNSTPTETNFLFWSMIMPRAVLLLLTTLIGFVLGALTVLLIGRKKSP